MIFQCLALVILLACSGESAFDDQVPLSLHIQLVYFGGSSDTNSFTCYQHCQAQGFKNHELVYSTWQSN